MFVSNRDYEVSDYDSCKPIPVENSSWYIDDKEWQLGDKENDGQKWNQQKGLAEMYHFRFHPLMEKNHVAVRTEEFLVFVIVALSN